MYLFAMNFHDFEPQQDFFPYFPVRQGKHRTGRGPRDHAGPGERARRELAGDFVAGRLARGRGFEDGGSVSASGSPLAARAAISSAGPVFAP